MHFFEQKCCGIQKKDVNLSHRKKTDIHLKAVFYEDQS